MGKRGMSNDEKKAAMKKVMQDAKEPFTLKQLEKLASKIGVNTMSVKGVVEELCDDGIVDMDKIGSTNWFWSFPSKELNALETKLKGLETENNGLLAAIEELTEKKEALLKERKPSEKRTALLEELRSLNAQVAEKELRIEEMQKNDPTKSLDAIALLETCRGAANRWTDNTWALEDYLKKKFGQNKKDVQRMLQMKDDFDYPVYTAPPAKKQKKR